MHKRAQRRHHKFRIRRRAFWLLKIRSWGDEYIESNWGLRRADNYTVCSCPMCGNPRRHGAWSYRGPRLTRQERRADLDLRDQLREVGL